VWRFETQQVWKSSPMTYAVDGKQYIGAVAGSTVRVFGLP
jgi:alcohol dehydrogenase (cytochrome c)